MQRNSDSYLLSLPDVSIVNRPVKIYDTLVYPRVSDHTEKIHEKKAKGEVVENGPEQHYYQVS